MTEHASGGVDAAAEEEARLARRLRQFRAFAGGLLAAMALGVLAASWAAHHAATPPGRAIWQMLAGSATAGLVGGLADWFAVTALFRRPLGLPIPHTAIIPAQKARLGAALGRFVGHRLLTAAELSAALSRLDVAGLLARTLRDPPVAASLERGAARLLPRLLEGMEDGRGPALLASALRQALGGRAAGPVLGRMLRATLESDRHQAVMTSLIAQARRLLREREPVLREFVEGRVREQGGRLVGWALGSAVASRVLAALSEEIDRLDPEGSELRGAVTQWMRGEIDRIETDPERAAQIGVAFSGMLAHPAMQDWLQGIWVRLRQTVAADAESPAPWIAGATHQALERLSSMLETDSGLRGRVDAAVAAALGATLPRIQVQVSEFIARVIEGWDADTLAERLEVRVGSDLQFIRINGTVFGFLAGLAINGALIWLGGAL
ncbi:uncharacterized membrane-anchored protein YjiN (DUF445 family) [Endobacter medicaginis]|uniref:Uncharacterized membrane-anchored protein YjiN (DUF445 family) n=2 Tax=Endobacter medicaginis TaxID=1181271 RepID=A0A839UW09_9PROT|nr:DUF445 domain-containing protein [Endobacter medicaginis]MBB3174488.1 uncharacterized membrane-anchored protein YjiN (DUF445 family) [Endobacter medicaginis]MCX5475063.1 DUF445 domain-containing protein [Endobacter medicaginis]